MTDTKHITDAWDAVKEMDLTQEQLNVIYEYALLRYAQGFSNGRAFKDWS
jgi:hypothetical protein